MSIPYEPNTPIASDAPSVSQPEMLQNFQSINAIWDVDHFNFGSNNAGLHEKSTYIDLGTDPSAAAGADIVYAKTVSGVIELFLRRPTGSPIQLTTGNITATANGTTFLPGGIIMKWGTINLAGASQAVVFGTPFPNNIFSVQITSLTTAPSTNGIMGYANATVAGFTAYQNGVAALTATYICIGN